MLRSSFAMALMSKQSRAAAASSWVTTRIGSATSSDADKKNTFDVERYIRVQRKKKKHPSAVIAPEEPFDLYEIELSDEDTDLTATE